MASQKTVLAEIRKAVKDMKTEQGEASAVARVLALYGHRTNPHVEEARTPDGRTLRAYIYVDTPAGDFLLVSGPGIEGTVETMSGPAAKSLADAGIYVQGRAAGGKTVSRLLSGMSRAATRTTRATKPAPEPKPRPKAKRATKAKAKRAPKAPPVASVPPPPAFLPPLRAPAITRGPARRTTEYADVIYEPVYRPPPPAAPANDDAALLAAFAAFMNQ